MNIYCTEHRNEEDTVTEYCKIEETWKWICCGKECG